MRIITGTYNEAEVTGREKALAEKITEDTKFREQVGKHAACHDRQKLKYMEDLEEKLEDGHNEVERAKLHVMKLEEELSNADEKWSAKWDARFEGFVTRFIELRAGDGEISPEVL